MMHMGPRSMAGVLLLPALSFALGSCAPREEAGVQRLGVEIVDTHPFDPASFTQGLEVEPGGTLLVGTGQRGESRIYRSTVAGEQANEQLLESEYFGEGITRHGDTVWQLTWQSGVAFERDAETLAEVARHEYPGEGWGLCSRENELIMSDGSDQLRRLDPDTFDERERFPITLDGRPVTGINELECVGDEVYANIFTETDIVRIDAETGIVDAVIDASAVPNNGPAGDPDAVLNGIAHIPDTDRFLITGKLWPDLYEVRFVPLT